MKNHTWTEKDDLKILYLYKFCSNTNSISKSELAKHIGVSLGSVSYRLGNFKAINGIGKADHIAKLSRKVHDKYSMLSEEKLKELAFKSA